jgi:hypothetical protein
MPNLWSERKLRLAGRSGKAVMVTVRRAVRRRIVGMYIFELIIIVVVW